MEDVLDVYHREFGETEVLVCLDETSKSVPDPIMVSLSNHRRLEQASFDRLRMSGRRW